MINKIKSILADDGPGDLITSKTIIGTVGLVLAVIANGYELLVGDNFLMALALFIGIAGYGFRNAIQKIVVALHKLSAILPMIESHLGRPSKDMGNGKGTLVDSKTVVGIGGVVVAILCEMVGMLPGDSFKISLAFSGGLAAIGGRLAMQRVIMILTKLIQLLPTIEAAIALTAEQGELRDPNGLKPGEVQYGEIIFEPTEPKATKGQPVDPEDSEELNQG